MIVLTHKSQPKRLKSIEVRSHAQPSPLQRIKKKSYPTFVFGIKGAMFSFGRAVFFTEPWESEGSFVFLFFTIKPAPAPPRSMAKEVF